MLESEGGEAIEKGDVDVYVTSWHAIDEIEEDENDEEDDDDEEDEDGPGGGSNEYWKTMAKKRYVIRAFGVSPSGRSTCVKIDGFTPFFYVKILSEATVRNPSAVEWTRKHLAAKVAFCRSAFVVQKKDFWGFSNGELFTFVRLTFSSMAAMRQAASKLTKEPVQTVRGAGSVRLAVYESNIDPLLRFVHVQNLRPVGWFRLGAQAYKSLPSGASTCQRAVRCGWQAVKPAPDLETRYPAPPLLVAGFDIECNSAHGDFPVAKKDYRRLAIDLEAVFMSCGGVRGGGASKGNSKASASSVSQYDCKSLMIEAMLVAFALKAPDASERLQRHKVKVSVLEIKQRTSGNRRDPWPPVKDGPEWKTLTQLIHEIVDDLYVLVTDAAPKFASSTGAPVLDDDDDGNGSAEKDTSVVGRLTDQLDRTFGKRWPLCGDAVIQIGLTVSVHGGNNKDLKAQHILTLGSCDPIDGATVRSFDDERALLLAFVDLLTRVDPDVLLGYNIFGFDMAYLYDRSVELGIEVPFCRFGRIGNVPSAYVEQKLSSSALGDNVLKYLDMHGRVVVDLMKVVQRDHRLDSYKLDSVAEHFLGLHKNDVSPNDVFRLQKGSSADRKVIAEYCIQDCALCNRLADKLQILSNNSGMANVCLVPLSFIFMRGQGVKIFSLVSRRCRDDGFLIPTRAKVGDPSLEEEEEGYEGAIVLEPETGMYLDDPVSVLDYNSLYPSSMISHNLSHDSLVIDPKYDRLAGVDYVEVTYDRYEGKGDDKRVVGKQVCRYARKGDETGSAVLPRILKDLLAQRKATRKRIEGESDPFVKAVLDGLQLAYKVTANSLYGQMGARTSPLYLKHIAACTTAVGRSMIVQAKEYVEGPECGGHVVYGDSVTGYTPVVVRMRSTGRIAILKIEDLAERYGGGRWVTLARESESDGKEACELGEVLDVWSRFGWARLERVIRHVLAPHKRILRVVTDTAVVDATDEHSLLDEDGLPVDAGDVDVGDRLFHRNLPLPESPTSGVSIHSRTEAKVLGMFVGCEGAGCYPAGFFNKSPSWAIRDADHTKLARYRPLLEAVYPDSHWEVQSDLVNGRPVGYVLAPSEKAEEGSKTLAAMVESTRAALYDGDQKIVPDGILNADKKDIRENFWEGLCDGANGRRKKYVSIDLKSQLTAARVYAIAASLGLFVYVKSWSRLGSNETLYRLTAYDPKHPRCTRRMESSPNAVKRVDEVPRYTGYVYDLTSETHSFAAGVGRMIVHNTDSIFIVFKNVDPATGEKLHGRDALASSIQKGQAASKGIKPHLAPPHNLEYEKTMFPLILLSKKRYVGLLYEDDPDAKPKQKSMGIALKRRDYAPIVKQIYGGIIDIILKERDIPKAVEDLRRRLVDLVEGRYSLSDLVISKTLRGYYKLPHMIAHWVLARRMYARDPGSAPQANDRIPFVFVETSKKNALMGDRIEHVDYVRQSDGKIFVDTKTYIENQIMKPCLQLLAIALEDLPGYVTDPNLTGRKALAKIVETKAGNVRKARERLDELRERKVSELLFAPVLAMKPIRDRDNRCNQQNDIHAYFKPKLLEKA